MTGDASLVACTWTGACKEGKLVSGGQMSSDPESPGSQNHTRHQVSLYSQSEHRKAATEPPKDHEKLCHSTS